MDELEALRRQFSTLQNQENKHSLSERNCIEVVLKLITSGAVDLLFTVDGKHYVTHKQLQLELEDEILRSGGRITVADLQPLLNVDLKHIEDKVQIVLRKGRLSLVDGEIFTNYYLDGVFEEIMEMLQETGKLNTQELASRFSMSTMFLEQVLEKRIARKIHCKAHLKEGIIYTDAFVKKHKATIRGIFAAITKPTSVLPLLSSFHLPEELALSALKDLINEGRLAGTLQGKKMYIPDLYETARTAYIDSFFHQNGYLAFDTLTRYDIPSPREYMQQRHPNGIELHTSYISQEVLNAVEYAISDALTSESWINVEPLVPTVLSDTDIDKVIELCPSVVSDPTTTICGHYVVSKKFVDRCTQLLAQDIKEEIQQKPQSQAQDEQPQENKATQEELESTPKGKRGKGAQKKTQKKDNVGTAKSPSIDEHVQVVQKLSKWLPQCDVELLEAIALQLQSTLNDLRQQSQKAVFKESMAQRKDKYQILLENFSSMNANILLFKKGIDDLLPTPEDKIALEKHLLKTVCTDIVSLLIEDLASQYCVSVKNIQSDKNALVSQLPLKTSQLLSQTQATLSKQSVEEFLVALDSLSEACQLPTIKKLDKKREKQLLVAHEDDFKNQLKVQDKPAIAFQLGVMVLWVQHYQAILHIPPKLIQTLVAKLKEKMPPQKYDVLKEFHSGVVKYLTAPEKAKDSLLQDLADKLPNFKDLVLQN